MDWRRARLRGLPLEMRRTRNIQEMNTWARHDDTTDETEAEATKRTVAIATERWTTSSEVSKETLSVSETLAEPSCDSMVLRPTTE